MSKILINLDHPCKGIDVIEIDDGEDERSLRGQGYASQNELKELTGMSFEIDESNNFPFDTWKWLQDRSGNEDEHTERI